MLTLIPKQPKKKKVFDESLHKACFVKKNKKHCCLYKNVQKPVFFGFNRFSIFDNGGCLCFSVKTGKYAAYLLSNMGCVFKELPQDKWRCTWPSRQQFLIIDPEFKPSWALWRKIWQLVILGLLAAQGTLRAQDHTIEALILRARLCVGYSFWS